jgi:hypothetical protein
MRLGDIRQGVGLPDRRTDHAAFDRVEHIEDALSIFLDIGRVRGEARTRQEQRTFRIEGADFHWRRGVDHALIPVYVGIEVTDQNGHTTMVIVGQIWVTVVIDVTTRYCLAVLFGIDPPSAVRTLAALKIAMCPKDRLFASIPKLKNKYDVAHIPASAGTDNGKDLPAHAEDVKAMLRDLNIEPELAGVHRGDHKSIVENFNGRIKGFFRKFPGAVAPKRSKFEPKDRRKKNKKPMTIEQVHAMGWRYVMDVYNCQPQSGLLDDSPQDLMQRDLARIAAERAAGKPVRARSILTKSPDEIERLFATRLTLRVRNEGVRHKYLLWNSGRLANCLGRDVQVRLNPENLHRVWVFDEQEGWFLVDSVYPFYTEGLSLFMHRRIRKRLREHESKNPDGRSGRRSFDMEKYLVNGAELLQEFYEIAGEADALTPSSAGRRELQLGTRGLGRSVDFAVAEGKRFAMDVRENRAPPGWGKMINLKKREDGTFYAESSDEVTKGSTVSYPKFEDDQDDDDDEDMMADPLRMDEQAEEKV